MEKYFALILDLLELDRPEQAMSVVRQITPNTKICCYHRYGFLFDGYLKLLRNEITVEEFLKIGDVESSIFLYPYQSHCSEQIIQLLDGFVEKGEKSCLYIIDILTWKLHKNILSTIPLQIVYC